MSALFCMILVVIFLLVGLGSLFRLRSRPRQRFVRAVAAHVRWSRWLGGGWGRVCIHVHTLAEVSTQTLSVLFTFSKGRARGTGRR